MCDVKATRSQTITIQCCSKIVTIRNCKIKSEHVVRVTMLDGVLFSMHLYRISQDIRAGPSQGSMRAEKYSYRAFLSGSMLFSFCHASGIIIITASGRLLPARTKSSRTPSNAPNHMQIILDQAIIYI